VWDRLTLRGAPAPIAKVRASDDPGMSDVVHVFVEGVPAKKKKTRGDLEVPARWRAALHDKTEKLEKIAGPCQLDIEFVLRSDSFPTDHPYGPDLDSLLKNTLDAMSDTVLRDVKGHDGAIVDIRARKRQARPGESTGARIIFAETVLPGPWDAAKAP